MNHVLALLSNTKRQVTQSRRIHIWSINYSEITFNQNLKHRSIWKLDN